MARKVKNSEALKAIQAKRAALNKQYRADAAKLKAAGVLSDKVNARKNITRATRTKINKFRDVLAGDYTPVKAKPEIREKYRDVIETRGAFLMVPKDRAKEKAKISRGLIEIDRPMIGPSGLQFGQEREVILPFKLTDMPGLVDRLQSDESLDGLKRPDEMFAFKIDGWASKIGFPDAKEMGDYISVNYAHLFKPKTAKQVVKYLTFVRYKNYGSARANEGTHKGFAMKKSKPRKRDKWEAERRRNKDATRKAEARKRETDADRAKRLAEQKLRSARNRQRKFDES